MERTSSLDDVRRSLEYAWQQKPWGYTCPLYLSPSFEFWTAHCLAGGYSSRHWHDLKHNTIYSRDATLLVEVWYGSGTVEFNRHILSPHSAISIAPGAEHRFTVLSSGRIYESYYGWCHPQDIVRRDTNGWQSPTILPSPYRLDR